MERRLRQRRSLGLTIQRSAHRGFAEVRRTSGMCHFEKFRVLAGIPSKVVMEHSVIQFAASLRPSIFIRDRRVLCRSSDPRSHSPYSVVRARHSAPTIAADSAFTSWSSMRLASFARVWHRWSTNSLNRSLILFPLAFCGELQATGRDEANVSNCRSKGRFPR